MNYCIVGYISPVKEAERELRDSLERKVSKQIIRAFLKKWPRRVETSDAGEVLHLLPNKPRDMGAKAEADKVGVVVDGDAHVLIDRPDESRNLK